MSNMFRPRPREIEAALEACRGRGIEPGEVLGGGTFAVVYEGQSAAWGEVAVKIMTPQGVMDDYCEREVNVQKSIDHANIVRIHDSFKAGAATIVVMERCHRSLDDFLEDYETEPAPEDAVRSIFFDILTGLDVLHRRSLIHRDMKEENILLKAFCGRPAGYIAKIADFGLVKEATSAATHVGTPLYEAPEVHAGAYDEKIDVWSVGIMLNAVIESRFNVSLRPKTEEAYVVPKELRRGYSDDMCDLLSKMLTRNPKRRISAAEALAHPWFEPLFPKIRLVIIAFMKRTRVACEVPCVVTGDFSLEVVNSMVGKTWADLIEYGRENKIFLHTGIPAFFDIDMATVTFIFQSRAYSTKDKLPHPSVFGQKSHLVPVFSSRHMFDMFRPPSFGDYPFAADLKKIEFPDIAQVDDPQWADFRQVKQVLVNVLNDFQVMSANDMDTMMDEIRVALKCVGSIRDQIDNIQADISETCEVVSRKCAAFETLLRTKHQKILPVELPMLEQPIMDLLGDPDVSRFTNQNGELVFHGLDCVRECEDFRLMLDTGDRKALRKDCARHYQRAIELFGELKREIVRAEENFEFAVNALYVCVKKAQILQRFVEKGALYSAKLHAFERSVCVVASGTQAPETLLNGTGKAAIEELNQIVQDMRDLGMVNAKKMKTVQLRRAMTRSPMLSPRMPIAGSGALQARVERLESENRQLRSEIALLTKDNEKTKQQLQELLERIQKLEQF